MDIIIVSGLPRSGTSMMMAMLGAGGVEVLTDGIREADADNLKGYYEFERVKKLPRDQAWLKEAEGRAVKVVSQLLQHLPPNYIYKVIFMQREMEEILASQRQMLHRRVGPSGAIIEAALPGLYREHLEQIEVWIEAQSNIDAITVSYNEVLEKPAESAERINQFLGGTLDVVSMAAVVDSALYRQRKC